MIDIIAIIGALLSIVGAFFTYIQVRAANRALRQAQLLKLFGSFDAASESTIANPELLYSVHGLNPNEPLGEARNIAYLSMLLDAFQHYYGEKYEGDFTKMVEEMKIQSTFLNRMLSVKGNKRRWDILKDIYYGGFDRSFIEAIEALMDYEKNIK